MSRDKPREEFEYIECACHSPLHRIRATIVDYDDESDPLFCLELVFLEDAPIWKRAWAALKYAIFGESPSFVEIILGENARAQLRESLQKMAKVQLLKSLQKTENKP